MIPIVIVGASQTFSLCDNVTIDATASAGNGGRSWEKVLWTVVDEKGFAVKKLESYLNMVGTDPSFPITVTPSYLPSTSIVISLSLRSFLKVQSDRNVKVTYNANPNVPTLSILGSSLVTVTPADALRLVGISQSSSCAINRKVSYSWSIYDGSVLTSISSSSTDPRILYLPPHTLVVGHTYTAVLNGSVPSSYSKSPYPSVNLKLDQFHMYPAVSVYTSTKVAVLHGNVYAVIKGGTTRQKPS